MTDINEWVNLTVGFARKIHIIVPQINTFDFFKFVYKVFRNLYLITDIEKLVSGSKNGPIKFVEDSL